MSDPICCAICQLSIVNCLSVQQVVNIIFKLLLYSYPVVVSYLVTTWNYDCMLNSDFSFFVMSQINLILISPCCNNSPENDVFRRNTAELQYLPSS